MLSPMRQIALLDDNNAISDRSKIKLVTTMLDLWSYMELKGHPITVTSTIGGKHKTNSRHYAGQAIDHIPDRGYSDAYVKCLMGYLHETGLHRRTRTLIEFNGGKVGDAGAYRCTHIEWSDEPDAKTGVYNLDYVANKSYPVQIKYGEV